jgi:carbonic anhydrase
VEARPGRQDPPDIFARLLAGNRRFTRDDPRYDRPRPRRGRSRPPFVAVLTCIDGRVPVDAAFDQAPGEICVIRSGAHVLDRAVLGSVALAVTTLRVGAVLVLGHTDCVAVMAATTAVRAGRDPVGAAGYVLEQIAPAVRDVGGTAPALEVVRTHVRRTVAHLRASAHLPWGDPAAVAGGVYHLDTGRVALLD